jgi:hypothetical protein
VLTAENVFEQALAQVFNGKPAGASMALEDIAIAWNNVGLRKSDLRDALKEMVECECLIVQNDLGNLSFALTERGAIRFYICLYCEANLQKRLGARPEVQGESASRDVLGRSRHRRSARRPRFSLPSR